MRHHRLRAPLIALLLLVFVLPAAATAAPSEDRIVRAGTSAGAPAAFPGQLNVKLLPGATLPLVTGILDRVPAFPGATADAGQDELARWTTIEVMPGSEQAVARSLEALPQVDVVERVPVRVPAYEPNDPRRGEQWHLDRISASSAWNIARGNRGIRVGIIDTQFDLGHPELRGVLFARDGQAGVDRYTEGCRPGLPYAEHGTLVAGVAAAATDNASGVSSVGFQIGVVAAQAGIELSGMCAISGRWTQALRDLADAGVPVVNLSFASPQTSQIEADTLQYATSQGTLVVAAAGNEGTSTPSFPAAHPLVVAVAATDSGDRLWASSNRGSWVDVAAPGVSLLTLCPGGYCYASGTSTAAPVVAAIATLLQAAQPGLEGLELRSRILDAAAEVTGRAIDPNLGYGRVRLDQTLSQRAVRLYGRDRIATAQAIAREAHATTGEGSVSRVVLIPANSPGELGWTVTLPAAGLLADGRTAFVMSGRERLHATAQDELDRLLDGSGEVVLTGSAGTGMSREVEQQLVGLGYEVTRLSGQGVAGTAASIADRIAGEQAPEAALIARGDTFADALSLSGPAAAHGYPLLFVDTDRVPAATCDWLGSHRSVTTLYIAGGTKAIARQVEGQLTECAAGGLLSGRSIEIVRDAGASRVDTAVAIAERHFGNIAPATASVANGYSWPDAVTGGTLAASHGAPVLTTAGAGPLEPAVRDYLDRGATRQVFVLGGPVVVSGTVESGLEAVLR
jgi:putative cell wall-binding protein